MGIFCRLATVRVGVNWRFWGVVSVDGDPSSALQLNPSQRFFVLPAFNDYTVLSASDSVDLIGGTWSYLLLNHILCEYPREGGPDAATHHTVIDCHPQ